MARLLVVKKDHEILGRGEFEVRDRVRKLGAQAVEAAVNLRKKGATEGPASTVRTAAATLASPAIAAKPWSASSARSVSNERTTAVRNVAEVSFPGTIR